MLLRRHGFRTLANSDSLPGIAQMVNIPGKCLETSNRVSQAVSFPNRLQEASCDTSLLLQAKSVSFRLLWCHPVT